MNQVRIIFVGLLMLCAYMAKPQTVTYNGLGRMYIIDDNFKGNLIKDDNTSPSSGTSGYTLFDLGLNIKPSSALKASAVIRSRTEFGGFFGDGSSFEFRQFNIAGVLGKGSKGVMYEMGDLDLELSKFTLYNNEESYNEFESDIFAERRDIVSYENFNFDNKWRLQGINLKTSLEVDKVIEKADIQLFGTRSKYSPTFHDPDRLLVGGKLKLIRDENLSLSANGTYLFDAIETVDAASNQYKNGVITGELDYKRALGDNNFALNAEFGISSFTYDDLANSATGSSEDYFYNINVDYDLTKSNLKLSLGYRNVGFNFISAASQTRRIFDNGVPSVFGSINANTAFRTPSLFDRYSQEALYNQRLSPTLMYYNPRYNLATPYGLATPNRQGFSLELGAIDEKKWYEYKVRAEYLQEVVGEGVADKRTFLVARGGTKLKLAQLLSKSKDIDLVIGGRYESSSRDDALVDFSTIQIDAGLDVEFANNLYLQVGYKALNSSGSELIGFRNEFNEIDTYTEFSSDQMNSEISESTVSAGLKWHFAKYSIFSFSAHFTSLKNTDNSDVDYSIDEYFFGYTLKF